MTSPSNGNPSPIYASLLPVAGKDAPLAAPLDRAQYPPPWWMATLPRWFELAACEAAGARPPRLIIPDKHGAVRSRSRARQGL